MRKEKENLEEIIEETREEFKKWEENQKQNWEDDFDKFMIDEYGKWKIGRIEAKSFIRQLLEKEKQKKR